MIISNTSPLIHLAKVGRLSLLPLCFQKVLIPEEVYEEIKCQPYSIEVIGIDRALQDGWLQRERVIVRKELASFPGIDKGELKAIALALEKKRPLIIDDKVGRIVATVLGVEAHGTLYVLLQARKNKLLTSEEVIGLLNMMIKNDFYLANDVYVEFGELLRKT